MAQKNINNNQAQTALDDATGVNATDTAFTTDGNTDFPTAPFSATIGDEAIMVTSTGAGTNWTVVRGIDGTTATSHADNAQISFKALAEDFALMKDETESKYYAQGDVAMDGNWLNFTATFADKDMPLASTSGTVTASWTFDTAANDGLINGTSGLGGEAADGVDVNTSQISTFSGLGASNALDTDISTSTGRSHTTNIAAPWWEMLFISPRVFEWEHFAIRAQNYGDGFLAQNFAIRGRDPNTGTWTTYATSNTDPGSSNWVTYDIAAGNGGVPPIVDGIRIEASDTNFLVLGSVEAWGTYYAGGITNSWGVVPIGTDGQVLTVVSGQPEWVGNAAGDASGAHMRLTSNSTAMTVNTYTDIDWDAEEYDDNAYWEGVTNPERITFTEAGRYLVTANIRFTGAGSGQRFGRAIRNGNGANQLAKAGPLESVISGDERMILTFIVDADADDYVTIQGYSTATSTSIMGAGSVGDDTETSRVQVTKLVDGYVDEIYWTSDVASVTTGAFEVPMKAGTIIDVRVRLGTAPTGSSVIFDVNKNGSTIFTTQGDRPTVATSSQTDTAVPNVTSVADGDYLTVDVDQVDSNSVGADAVLVVRYRRS